MILFTRQMLALLLAVGLLLGLSCAGSVPKISEAIRSAPSMDAVSGLNDQLLWIMSHAETGGEYAVMLDSDYGALTEGGNLTFPKNSDISNVTITIKSTGGKRTISPAHFKVGYGVTLILDSNITLKGPPMENGEGTAPSNDVAVSVYRGTFVMNEGSAIIGNTNNNGISGGGVLVNGAFYMNGGTISGNKCIAGKSLINSYAVQRVTRSVDKVIGGAFLVATGGKAPASADIVYPASNGGGVYVYGTGIFVKTGGTITGYDSDPENGNVVIDGGWPGKGIVAAATPYTVKPNGGHAIYFGDSKNFSIPYKVVNTTVGHNECFEFRNGIYKEMRCENPKPEQPAQDTLGAQGQQPVASAQQPQPMHERPKIAVYVFGAEDPALNKAMATRLVPALSNSGRYQVAQNYKEFFELATEEQQKGGAASMKTEQIKTLGKQFDVEYVCVAEITTALGEKQVSAHILNVETAEITATGVADVPLKTSADLTAAAEQIVGMMFKNMPMPAEVLPPAPVAVSPPPPPQPEIVVPQTTNQSSKLTYQQSKADDSGMLTDDRDGKRYKTVVIGGKKWMAENLNYYPQSGKSWCYDNDNSNCGKYGRLYDWNTAKTVCPSGFHLPSREEWNNLVSTVGGNKFAGKKLQARSGWKKGKGTDEYGLSTLPGGSRNSNGGFRGAGNYGYWWTATERGSGSYYRSMSHSSGSVIEGNYNKNNGYSVRCVNNDAPIRIGDK